jgi:UDP-N-acetyl-2-amino-2-deoxyglucuronate dehydrogenase
MSNFALTGVAGYIAPRHLKAIQAVGGDLLAACDPHDSVGVLDSYFPKAAFFKEFERFDRHLEKLRRAPEEDRVHYVSICSPNHLHDAHIRQALRVGADAICEKPIVLNPWNLDALAELEEEYGQRIWTVLQLRVHPAILELKRKLEGGAGNVGNDGNGRRFSVDLTYITTRGQ